jgi:hypothetical protein
LCFIFPTAARFRRLRSFPTRGKSSRPQLISVAARFMYSPAGLRRRLSIRLVLGPCVLAPLPGLRVSHFMYLVLASKIHSYAHISYPAQARRLSAGPARFFGRSESAVVDCSVFVGLVLWYAPFFVPLLFDSYAPAKDSTFFLRFLFRSTGFGSAHEQSASQSSCAFVFPLKDFWSTQLSSLCVFQSLLPELSSIRSPLDLLQLHSCSVWCTQSF